LETKAFCENLNDGLKKQYFFHRINDVLLKNMKTLRKMDIF